MTEIAKIHCYACGMSEEEAADWNKEMDLPVKVGDKCELCGGMFVIWTQEMQDKRDESYRDYKDNKWR